jgi:hypothetical protein
MRRLSSYIADAIAVIAFGLILVGLCVFMAWA